MRVTALSRGSSLSALSLRVFLFSRSTSLCLCAVPFSFPVRLSPLLHLVSPPRVHLRPSDTNGQSKLRHYEVPGAEVTPLYGATHHFGAAIPHVGETPLGFSRRERDPLLPPPLSLSLSAWRCLNASTVIEGHPGNLLCRFYLY